MHSQKLGEEHGRFLTLQKKQKSSISAAEDEEKQAKMLKLEVPAAENTRDFEYFYEVEGEDLELSHLTVRNGKDPFF